MKPSLKKTDVGSIPEDWEASPLPNTIWFQEGPGLRNWQFRSNGLKVINVTNLQGNGYLDLSTTERHISWEECEKTYKHFLVDDGDVVIASSGNSYCKVAVVRKSDLPLLMNTSVIRFKAKAKISRSFMLTYLKSKYFKAQIDLMITGGAQPNFGPFHLRKVVIPLPPTKTEQEAIAEALSDADALIESLEQLLSKKRQLKQGAMQELLTGKKRLPGFSEEWEVKRLGEIAHIKTGGRNNQDKIEEGQYPFFVRSATVERINSYSYDCEAILVPGEGGIGNIFHYVHGRFDVHQRVYAVTQFSPETSGRFIYFYMAEKFGAHAMQNSVKATVDSLRLPTFQNFEIVMPPTAEEQIAIAAVLSDMDAEIAALEAKLTKARRLKQGMMQELLTGRIRLV